jgi:hypothetical protein
MTGNPMIAQMAQNFTASGGTDRPMSNPVVANMVRCHRAWLFGCKAAKEVL